MELAEGTKNREELTPDYETGTPYDWEGIVNHILTHS